jgi:hypothetical protein
LRVARGLARSTRVVGDVFVLVFRVVFASVYACSIISVNVYIYGVFVLGALLEAWLEEFSITRER